MALNNVLLNRTAQFGSSIIIFGDIRSWPGAFFGYSCSLITFSISFGEKFSGVVGYPSETCGSVKPFGGGFGFSASLRAHFPVLFPSASIGILRQRFAFHNDCLLVVRDSFSIYRRCSLPFVHIFYTLTSLGLMLDDGAFL